MAINIGLDGGLTISVQSADRKRSAAWYAEMLGFTLLYDVEHIGWCEMSTHIKGVNIGFSQVEKVKAGGPTPTWGVKDVDSARKQLEGRGVKFDGDTLTFPGMVKLATFFDPDGNANMLYQSLAQQ
ncbi:MAG: VOC family protein [Phycisphaeraceae bacterium]|nr:VOC family protein [Phycisphaeraceae bacterium]MBX3407937.1 VOC family protein [Phycisphaeraceae bacterium]